MTALYLQLIVFWGCTIFLVVRHRRVNIAVFLLSLYGISSATSIYFINNITFISEQDINIYAIIYYFIMVLISVFPFALYSNRLSETPLKLFNNKGKIELFVLFCSPFIIEIFFEYFYCFITTQQDSLATIYEDDIDILSRKLSFIGKKINYLFSFISYLWPILLIYSLKKNNKKMTYILLLQILNEFLKGYICAGRVYLVRYVLYLVLVFLIGEATLSAKVKKYAIIGFVSVLSFIVVLLTYITVSRYDSMNSDSMDIMTWVSLYLGEGCLRFSQYIWNMDAISYGDTCFSGVKSLLGMETYTDNEIRRLHYEPILKIPTHIFYSYVGDIVIDFGKGIAFLLNILCSFFTLKILKRVDKQGYINGTQFFILLIISNMIAFGFMYFVYKIHVVQIGLLVTIILLSFLQSSKKNI